MSTDCRALSARARLGGLSAPSRPAPGQAGLVLISSRLLRCRRLCQGQAPPRAAHRRGGRALAAPPDHPLDLAPRGWTLVGAHQFFFFAATALLDRPAVLGRVA
jgi:hypothetical protein